MKRALIIALLLVSYFPVRALAETPLEALRQPVDQVISILADPKYKNADAALKEEQRKALWKLINQQFDFTEVAKRALARHWRDFSLEERKEFRDLFAELLGNIYLSKIQGSYEGEKVLFKGQDMQTDTKAMVNTVIKLTNGELPVDYSMLLKKGQWKVYDVNVEGVSLVKNYRVQFDQALEDEKPKDLIETLRKKVEAQRKGENESE